MKHPTKVVKVGDQVEAVVLEVKQNDRRVSLGIKQLEADPWTTVGDRYSIGSVVEGRVRKLTDAERDALVARISRSFVAGDAGEAVGIALELLSVFLGARRAAIGKR